MRDTLEPGRSRAEQRWAGLVGKHRVLRWVVDGWWFEHSRVASGIIAACLEAGTYVVGLMFTPIPTFMVLTAARMSTYLNGLHTGFLALRHRDFTLFNQPQIWHRREDGTIARRIGHRVHEVDDSDRPTTLLGHARGFLSDFWTERRRLPGMIVAVATPPVAFVMGAVLHFPVATVAAVLYGSVILQSIPQARNALLSLTHRTIDYFDKPQTIRKGERPGRKAPEPAAIEAVPQLADATAPEPAAVLPAPFQPAIPSPAVIAPRLTVPAQRRPGPGRRTRVPVTVRAAAGDICPARTPLRPWACPTPSAGQTTEVRSPVRRRPPAMAL